VTIQLTTKTLDRLADFVEPGLDTTYATHGLHPYPAKFIPQIPASIIEQHTNERHVIFDPFCGSGTTLVEAVLAGRRSIGCDSNPIAALVSRAKTTPIRDDAVVVANALIIRLREADTAQIPDHAAPADERLSHWFKDHVIAELAFVRHEISQIQDPPLRQLCQAVFSSIIVSVSNQESDTRYAAVDKSVRPGDVIRRFVSRLEKALLSVRAINTACKHDYLEPKVLCGDIRTVDAALLPENSADLVVTSPPYANSFDYYLYHKWRMIWLGFSHSDARAVEIGSRYEHSSQKAPLEVFERKMASALQSVSRALKPSKLAYFLVGDSVLSGELIDAEASLKRSAEGTGLRFVDAISYPLGKISRSFREKASDGCHGGSKHTGKKQRVLVFECTNAGERRPSRVAISSRAKPKLGEVQLEGVVTPGSRIALKSADTDRHVHSLARYPSKFVPAVPRWAIDTFTKAGDVVFDPFSGSGTTSVEAVLLGRNAMAADVSPFACLATEAKTTRVAPSEARSAVEGLLSRLSQGSLPKTRGLRFDLDSFWFDLRHLDEFESIRRYITLEVAAELQSFLLLCLAGSVRKFGYQDEAQIKVKRDAKKVASGTPSPSQILLKSLPKQLDRLLSFLASADPDVTSKVYRTSASEPIPGLESADLVVTSPPYINAMNYPMTHRYENILLGLVPAASNRQHETEYFGSERVKAEGYRHLHQVPSEWACAATLNRALAEIHESEPKRSFICFKYFEGMRAAFELWANTLKPGARVALVCGRNKIRGVPIDTVGFLGSFFEDVGFKTLTSFEYEIVKQSLRITRHATSDLIHFDGVVVAEKPSESEVHILSSQEPRTS
jgi:DNA modification methylase